MTKQATVYKSIIFVAVVLVAVLVAVVYIFYSGVLGTSSNVNGHSPISSNKPSSNGVNITGYNKNVSQPPSTKYYNTIFVESNLPSNTMWSAIYNNNIKQSNLSYIEFNTTYGSFSYSISQIGSDSCGDTYYLPNPSSGNLTAGSVQQITFNKNTSPECKTSANNVTITNLTTTFTETGLPTSSTWSVTYDGIVKSSTSPTIYFSTLNGTYSYSIPQVGGSSCGSIYYTASPSSGSLAAGSSESITFTSHTLPSCNANLTTTFTETGLPSGYTWNISYDGVSSSANIGSPITVVTPSGTFMASASVKGLACTSTASVAAGSSYTFSNWYCTTTFTESGLPALSMPNNWWTVYYDDVIGSEAITPSLTFVNSPGIYPFAAPEIEIWSSATCGSIYYASPSLGNLTAGSSISLDYYFEGNVCETTFTETGLPSGTTWNVTYDGQVYASSNSSITILSPPGDFTWQAYGLDYICVGGIAPYCSYKYSPSPSSGSITAGDNQTISYS